jgi:hypothetical protein
MINLNSTIPEFLDDSRILIKGIMATDLIKERILPFNYTEERLLEVEAVYNAAVAAESNKAYCFGIKVASKEIADKAFEEAKTVFGLHSAILKTLLRDDVEMLKKLFLVGQPRTQRPIELLKIWLEVYDRVLAEPDLIAKTTIVGLTTEKLQEGKQVVTAAQTAKEEQTQKKGDAQDATTERDKAFNALLVEVDLLVPICRYVLNDRPQLLEKLGILVYSPGYRPKKKTTDETPTEPPVEPPPEPLVEPPIESPTELSAASTDEPMVETPAETPTETPSETPTETLAETPQDTPTG